MTTTHDTPGPSISREQDVIVVGAGPAGTAAAAVLAESGRRVLILEKDRFPRYRIGESMIPYCWFPLEKIGALDRIDILVNVAGTNYPEPLAAVTEEHFDRTMALNVKATFMVSQVAAGLMEAGGRGGVIINVSSQMGHVGAPNRTVYCASKHALEGLTKAMAVELAPHAIRVNSIGPTFILTPMTRPFFDDAEFRDDTLSRIPMGRLGELEDIMGAVVFLSSPAAALITGAALTIDGGWTAW